MRVGWAWPCGGDAGALEPVEAVTAGCGFGTGVGWLVAGLLRWAVLAGDGDRVAQTRIKSRPGGVDVVEQ